VILAGEIVAVAPDGTAEVQCAEGPPVPCRCPQHVSVAWLRAALARGPVPVEISAAADRRTGTVWCVLPAPCHEGVVADALELRAGKEVRIACGEASVTLARDGRLQARGRDVAVRGSRTARLQGGTVKIN
jgi:hypothetical protein